ncbi:hypothetical protein [Gordonia rhizosphera]|uniref:Uncharacterized protein n=1 Tax=Gordonia rhizosphera NBRC 16068 TaxID=1108045 RepID=K6WEF7_9ACTN|nr:hypothetical protein [Gordonia rhizosphera]GAB92131.1 hypothetical protein GORHZ_164_00240 [Gordonia rhizosphera NBRC 16068]
MARRTPDSHGFPTRPYDLVKEFTIALVVVLILSVGLAAIFSSPDERPITLKAWAQAAPNDVIATAAGELAGTTASATYGPPYNNASDGQKLGPLPLQKWGGVRLPVDSADLVLDPLGDVQNNPRLGVALARWKAATPDQRTRWATDYSDAIGTPATDGEAATGAAGDPAAVAPGDYGPVPTLSSEFLTYALSGGLEGALTSAGNFYGGDATRSLLLLSDGAYLEDQARAKHLGGDQWGMMNEVGNAPGQPWMWLYTFWYQVPPFSTSDNADALVWGLMILLTILLMLVPFIPGVRSIPRLIPVHRLVWRDYYRRTTRP